MTLTDTRRRSYSRTDIPTRWRAFRPDLGLINHVAIVLDESMSMSPHQETVVRVVDGLTAHLARRSQELKQETRITVYGFGSEVVPLVFDVDVMRHETIKGLYRLAGNTALRDAFMVSQEDLDTTSTVHGDHAFVTYVVTDGEENDSQFFSWGDVERRLSGLPENYSVGVLVPDAHARRLMVGRGFSADSVTVWDVTSGSGFEAVGRTVTASADRFMEARATGVRGTRKLFSAGADAVNDTTVKTALTPMDPTSYRLVPVPVPPGGPKPTTRGINSYGEIRDFVESTGFPFRVGRAFYQLTKGETIQGTKEILILDTRTDRVYSGHDAVRELLGLTDNTTRVPRPEKNPDYVVFVQSTSTNRHVEIGTRVLILV